MIDKKTNLNSGLPCRFMYPEKKLGMRLHVTETKSYSFLLPFLYPSQTPGEQVLRILSPCSLKPSATASVSGPPHLFPGKTWQSSKLNFLLLTILLSKPSSTVSPMGFYQDTSQILPFPELTVPVVLRVNHEGPQDSQG